MMTEYSYPVFFALYLGVIGTYSAAMILFGRWLALSGFVVEEVDETEEFENELCSINQHAERWIEGSDGSLVPRADRIHVIPVEQPLEGVDPGSLNEHLHCAQVNCWCNPKFAEYSDSPELEGKIVNHNPLTQPHGWIMIGENFSSRI